MNDLPYAEDVNYFKTGQSSPETWIRKARKEIEDAGGKWLADAFGADAERDTSAFMVRFELQGDRFTVTWPVLPTKADSELAARRQAATMLYHDVKAACVKVKVLGARAAFFAHLELPDGRTAAQTAVPELMELTPTMLALPSPASD